MDNFFDFNNAPQQNSGELIPAKTFLKVIVTIRPGAVGEGGWATKSASGFEYLNLELTVLSAPMAKRKIFTNAGIGGTTDGHEKAAEITRSLLRGILESARGIDPADESEKARKSRVIKSWGDLDGMEFAIEVGIEKGKDGYDDKNKIQRVITPGHKYYTQVMAGETIMPGSAAQPSTSIPSTAKAASSTIPAWAR